MSNLKVHVMILNILNSRLKKSEFPISLVREAFRVEPDHRLPVPERDGRWVGRIRPVKVKLEFYS